MTSIQFNFDTHQQYKEDFIFAKTIIIKLFITYLQQVITKKLTLCVNIKRKITHYV